MNRIYPDFDFWFYVLNVAGREKKMWTNKTLLCPKSWKVYWDEGLSVLEALKADIKNQ